MDQDNIGSLLKSSIKVESKLDQIELDDLIDKLDHTGKVASLPSLLSDITFPKSYTNRFGFRVDLYGRIERNTHEYNLGYRFFDSNADFYFEDGTSSKESIYDLVSEYDRKTSDHTARPFSKLSWIHTFHRNVEYYFSKVFPGETSTKINSHYINRMGFLVSIDSGGYSKSANVYQDTQGIIYHSSCQRLELSESMYDLIHEIKDVSSFLKSDWSTETVKASLLTEEDIPELFNPDVPDPTKMLRDFYNHILKSNELSQKLGINYTFSIIDLSSTR